MVLLKYFSGASKFNISNIDITKNYSLKLTINGLNTDIISCEDVVTSLVKSVNFMGVTNSGSERVNYVSNTNTCLYIFDTLDYLSFIKKYYGSTSKMLLYNNEGCAEITLPLNIIGCENHTSYLERANAINVDEIIVFINSENFTSISTYNLITQTSSPVPCNSLIHHKRYLIGAHTKANIPVDVSRGFLDSVEIYANNTLMVAKDVVLATKRDDMIKNFLNCQIFVKSEHDKLLNVPHIELKTGVCSNFNLEYVREDVAYIFPNLDFTITSTMPWGSLKDKIYFSLEHISLIKKLKNVHLVIINDKSRNNIDTSLCMDGVCKLKDGLCAFEGQKIYGFEYCITNDVYDRADINYEILFKNFEPTSFFGKTLTKFGVVRHSYKTEECMLNLKFKDCVRQVLCNLVQDYYCGHVSELKWVDDSKLTLSFLNQDFPDLPIKIIFWYIIDR